MVSIICNNERLSLYRNMVHRILVYRIMVHRIMVYRIMVHRIMVHRSRMHKAPASEIRDTLPLLFTTSEIRGIWCL